MQYRSLTGAITVGVVFSIVVALANGLSTHVLADRNTISEKAREVFGIGA